MQAVLSRGLVVLLAGGLAVQPGLAESFPTSRIPVFRRACPVFMEQALMSRSVSERLPRPSHAYLTFVRLLWGSREGAIVTRNGKPVSPGDENQIHQEIALAYAEAQDVPLSEEKLELIDPTHLAQRHQVEIVIVPGLERFDSFLIGHAGKGGTAASHAARRVYLTPNAFAELQIMPKAASQQVLERLILGHLNHRPWVPWHWVRLRYPLTLFLTMLRRYPYQDILDAAERILVQAEGYLEMGSLPVAKNWLKRLDPRKRRFRRTSSLAIELRAISRKVSRSDPSDQQTANRLIDESSALEWKINELEESWIPLLDRIPSARPSKLARKLVERYSNDPKYFPKDVALLLLEQRMEREFNRPGATMHDRQRLVRLIDYFRLAMPDDEFDARVRLRRLRDRYPDGTDPDDADTLRGLILEAAADEEWRVARAVLNHPSFHHRWLAQIRRERRDFYSKVLTVLLQSHVLGNRLFPAFIGPAQHPADLLLSDDLEDLYIAASRNGLLRNFDLEAGYSDFIRNVNKILDQTASLHGRTHRHVVTAGEGATFAQSGPIRVSIGEAIWYVRTWRGRYMVRRVQGADHAAYESIGPNQPFNLSTEQGKAAINSPGDGLIRFASLSGQPCEVTFPDPYRQYKSGPASSENFTRLTNALFTLQQEAHEQDAANVILRIRLHVDGTGQILRVASLSPDKDQREREKKGFREARALRPAERFIDFDWRPYYHRVGNIDVIWTYQDDHGEFHEEVLNGGNSRHGIPGKIDLLLSFLASDRKPDEGTDFYLSEFGILPVWKRMLRWAGYFGWEGFWIDRAIPWVEEQLTTRLPLAITRVSPLRLARWFAGRHAPPGSLAWQTLFAMKMDAIAAYTAEGFKGAYRVHHANNAARRRLLSAFSA